jgi:DNA topoisomerase-1
VVPVAPKTGSRVPPRRGAPAPAAASKPAAVPTDEKCEKCGSPMVVRNGRFGEFLGCSAYPRCKNIKKLPKA